MIFSQVWDFLSKDYGISKIFELELASELDKSSKLSSEVLVF